MAVCGGDRTSSPSLLAWKNYDAPGGITYGEIKEKGKKVTFRSR